MQISDTKNSIIFSAKPRRLILKKSRQIVTTAGIGIAGISLSNNNRVNTNSSEDDVSKRELLIKTKILEKINNKKNITIKALAKELNIPLHLVVTSLYRAKSNIRGLFDKVKNTSYMRKPASDGSKTVAQNIINSSKSFLTAGTNPPFEYDYVSDLGRKFDKLEMSQEETEGLKNLYKTKPALADLILFQHSKWARSGFVSPGTYEAISAAHDINPELTETLITEKKADGYNYSLKDICKIVEINQISEELLEPAKNDTTLLYTLVTAKTRRGKPRFGSDDILQIIKSMKEDADFVEILMTQKNKYSDYRFNGRQIRLILKTKEKYPYIVSNLVNSQDKEHSPNTKYKYSSYCIEKILETLEGDDYDKAELVLKLLKKESFQNSQKSPSEIILSAIEKYEG